MTANIETFTEHLTNPVLPDSLRARFICPTWGTRPMTEFSPGLECEIMADPPEDHELAVICHAIVDRDWQGQFMYLQVCRRNPGEGPFGSWHYGFYYRGGDSSWDEWTLDQNYGTENPSYATFGIYVDEHNQATTNQGENQ